MAVVPERRCERPFQQCRRLALCPGHSRSDPPGHRERQGTGDGGCVAPACGCPRRWFSHSLTGLSGPDPRLACPLPSGLPGPGSEAPRGRVCGHACFPNGMSSSGLCAQRVMFLAAHGCKGLHRLMQHASRASGCCASPSPHIRSRPRTIHAPRRGATCLPWHWQSRNLASIPAPRAERCCCMTPVGRPIPCVLGRSRFGRGRTWTTRIATDRPNPDPLCAPSRMSIPRCRLPARSPMWSRRPPRVRRRDLLSALLRVLEPCFVGLRDVGGVDVVVGNCRNFSQSLR